MRKKIAHLLISFGNKNQVYTSNLLESLQTSSKCEHFVFCHYAYKRSTTINVIASGKINKLISLLITIKLYASNEYFRTYASKSGRKELFKWAWLMSSGIDVLHVHHEHAISSKELEFFKSNNVKIVLSLRGRDLLVNTAKTDALMALGSKIDLCHTVHCISYYMDDCLWSNFQVRSKVVYRGQDQPEIENLVQAITPTQDLKMIAVGRLVWEKGHIFLIESIHRLRAQGHSVRLDIYGEGNLREFLEFRIKQLRLQENVSLKGHLPNMELKKQYANYDIAVQPSLTEALSNALIDFTFHNLPCVISDAGGMTEVIKHEVNGIVFSNLHMIQLDTAILRAKNINRERLQKYNDGNREKFSTKNEVSNMLKLYLS